MEKKEFILIEKRWIENTLTEVTEALNLDPESKILQASFLILSTLSKNSLKSSVEDRHGLDSIVFKTELKKDDPYIKMYRLKEDLFYNKDFGDNKECQCGHPYYRHFDTYEQMEAIGCKYCQCYTFEEKTNN